MSMQELEIKNLRMLQYFWNQGKKNIKEWQTFYTKFPYHEHLWGCMSYSYYEMLFSLSNYQQRFFYLQFSKLYRLSCVQLQEAMQSLLYQRYQASSDKNRVLQEYYVQSVTQLQNEIISNRYFKEYSQYF